MRKIILLFCLLILCSCTTNKNYNYTIKTIVKENTNTVIAINYPITNIKNINNNIRKYVNKEYNSFLDNYNKKSYLNKKYELNIDYSYYNLSNLYISIVLYNHISSTDNVLNINKIYNYVYDIKNNKKINFKYLLDENQNLKPLINNLLIENYGDLIIIDKLQSIDYNNLNFLINNKYVKIFFEGNDICENYNDILEIEIPITYFNKLKNIIHKDQNAIKNITQPINYIDISKPVVALTFDDGPSDYTNDILDTLKKYNSNATFFVLGNKIDDYNETIIKMYQNGNEIGNHSYNHRWLTRISLESQREQISKTQELIKKYTNYEPIYLRPTYGSVNKNLRNNTSLEIVLWNIDTKDWKYKNVDKIVDNALKDIKDESIILMHDTYKRTSDAVKIIIPKLIENGYQLVTIRELKEIQKIRNKIYAE